MTGEIHSDRGARALETTQQLTTLVHDADNKAGHGMSTVGPEASLFTPVVLLIAAAIFSRRYKEIRYRHAGSAHDA